MRRIITLTAIALGLSGGVALADRRDNNWRGGRGEVRDHREDNRRPQVRDNRNDNRGWRNNDRGSRGTRTVRVERQRPTFRNNRFYFTGGTYRPYVRPVINVRYRDYYRRPALVVENYDAVPGYIWIAGSWSWTGYEWSWLPGHYDVDQNYYDDSYDQGSYDQGSYDQGSYDPAYYQPGFHASASFGF